MGRPIRVAFSPLTERFYAFSSYKSETRGGQEVLTVTGKKYDVTQDIAAAVTENHIEFSIAKPSLGPEK